MQAVNFVWKADELIWRNKSKLRINEIIKKNNYEYVFFVITNLTFIDNADDDNQGQK